MRTIKNRVRQWPWLVSLWYLLRRTKDKLLKPHPKRFYDLVLQKDRTSHLTKRALVSYIVLPFSIPRDDRSFFVHINKWRAKEIVRVLNQLAYIVDVVDYRDTSFVPRRKYDLFIGHAGINFETIVEHLPGNMPKIYFSTGCYWKWGNEQKRARLTALQERKGIRCLESLHYFVQSEEGALAAADGVIGIGNEFTSETYAGFSPVIMINNTAFADDHAEQQRRDFSRARNHFLYLAGGDNIRKGLDLMLEAFLQLKRQHLWICSLIEPQLAEIYKDALQNRPNIHLVGWVQICSAQFYNIVNLCGFIICPSCNEGQPHSVIECMGQGLVPIVSQACGIDVRDYGVMLCPCSIEEIVSVVQRLSDFPAEQLQEMSRKVCNVVVDDYSESAFARRFSKAIRDIVSFKLKGRQV